MRLFFRLVDRSRGLAMSAITNCAMSISRSQSSQDFSRRGDRSLAFFSDGISVYSTSSDIRTHLNLP